MADTENESQQAIETIRECATEIDKTKATIKNLREQALDIKEGMAAYDEYTKASDAAKAAKENLRLALMGKAEYNNIMEEIALEADKLKDAQEIISQHIAYYWRETGERQIEVDHNNGDAREIIVKGKLGAKQKYQTNLFSDNDRG